MRRVQAVLAAGGEGRRFGGETPKQLLEVGGRPVIEWSVDLLRRTAEEVVVALPEAFVDAAERRFESWGDVRCVRGGGTRWQSVCRALEVLESNAGDLVAIHDGARPALAQRDLESVLAAAQESGAAVLGRPVSDTLKRVEDGVIVETVDRTGLFRAETPQVFEADLLSRISLLAAERSLDPTDESSLVELLDGVVITAVTASQPNPKLTHRGDLAQVEALLVGDVVGSSGSR